MGIASWSGPLRRYVDKPVIIKERDAVTAITGYVNSFLNKKLSSGEASSAIQATLSMCFGWDKNFRLLITATLSAVEKEPMNNVTEISKLLTACRETK